MATRPSRFHTCPVQGCIERVPNRLLMCRRHWGIVPAGLRREHLANYRECGTGDHIQRRMASLARLGSAQRCIEAAGRR